MIAILRRAAVGTLAAAAAILSAAAAAQAGPLEFTVVNDSEFTVFGVYVSPDYSDSWGENVLAEVMLPGDEVRFTNEGDHCIHDVLVENRYGDVAEFYGVDLCRPATLFVE